MKKKINFTSVILASIIYFIKRPNCLILSAKDGEGKRLATIEYDMKNLTIVQCRAACNQVPERDAEIRGLINSNTATIQKLVAESFRKSA